MFSNLSASIVLMIMPILTWFSLKPLPLNPEYKITISYGVDEYDMITCTRVDLRAYYNGWPTRNGINLKRWELLQLGRYID